MSFASMRRLQAEAAKLQAESYRLEARAALEWMPNTDYAMNCHRLANVYDMMAADHLKSAKADEVREAKP
jgi:hypothetical protein